MPKYTMPERGRVGLLTINAQGDFTTRSSPLRSCGVSQALPAMERLVAGFRAQNRPIFHAVRLYRPDGSNVDLFRRMAVEEGLRILMPGTKGAELLESLRPSPDARLDSTALLQGQFQDIGENEWIFYKPRWGAFFGTSFEDRLTALGITSLVVCGFNFTTSGRATIYEAGARDFRVVLASDAVSGASEDSICELGRIGVYLMTADNCLDWLSGKRASHAA